MVPGSEGSAEFIGIMNFILFMFLGFITIFIMGFFETSERRIPIQQTGQGLNLIKDKETYLPMKINPAGIVPVIFASAIITLPPTIAQFFSDSSQGRYIVEEFFKLTHWFGLTLYSLLIIGFTFFYSQININPTETAENFQKSSTFIMGVKPGKDTELHLKRTLNSMSAIGAAVLTTIAILPYLMTFMGIPESIAIGGTSMIIMVSVAIET
jgi:preprotein translocase subunit SecY